MIGRKLSHFRIVSRLGEGGMGVVYKAEDERLQRTVALKVLPPERLGNEESRLRILREARLAAAISHPNIAVVHEIDEEDGVVFVAMELIEGKTLGATIGGTPLPLDEALRLGAEIAEGLAAAHQARVIHRDLKPENVIVTPDRRVKILDFGLAKVLEADRSPSSEATSRLTTISDEMTQAGRVMGTTPYMSPEQVRGQRVDARSDLFAFGIVLYEMVTGKRPFYGATSMDVMTAILREEPAPPSTLNAEVPPELDRIVAKCVEKDPNDRYQDTRDLVVDLRRLKKDTTSGARRGTLTTAPVKAVVPARRRGVRVAALLGAAVLIAAGTWALVPSGWNPFHRPAIREVPVDPLQSMKMTLLMSSDELGAAAMSPDGRYLAYSLGKNGKGSLWIKQIATGSDIQVLPPQADFGGRVRFTPDGNYIYYAVNSGETAIYTFLYRVATLGGAPRKILFDVDSAVTFSPDGKQIAFLRGRGDKGETDVMIANADGTGERRLVVKSNYELSAHGDLSWSPDGKRLAIPIASVVGDVALNLVELSVNDGKETTIAQTPWVGIDHVVWLPDGSGLVVTALDPGVDQSQLWMISYPEGTRRRITNELNDYGGFSIAADSRTIAASRTRRSARLWALPLAGSGDPKQLTTGFPSDDAVSQLAPMPGDGIVVRSPQDGHSDLWVIEPGATQPRRLSPEHMGGWFPHVARSSGAIVFTGVRDDRVVHAWKVDRDGENLIQLTNGKGEQAVAVSPDGDTVLFFRFDDPGLWKLSLRGGQPVQIGQRGSPTCEFSSDGTRILLAGAKKDSAGRLHPKLYLTSADDGKPIGPMIDAPGWLLHWAPSGDAVTYIREVDGIANIWSQPLAGGAPRRLTDFKSGQIWEHAYSTDGKQLFMLRGQESSEVVLITNFR